MITINNIGKVIIHNGVDYRVNAIHQPVVLNLSTDVETTPIYVDDVIYNNIPVNNSYKQGYSSLVFSSNPKIYAGEQIKITNGATVYFVKVVTKTVFSGSWYLTLNILLPISNADQIRWIPLSYRAECYLQYYQTNWITISVVNCFFTAGSGTLDISIFYKSLLDYSYKNSSGVHNAYFYRCRVLIKEVFTDVSFDKERSSYLSSPNQIVSNEIHISNSTLQMHDARVNNMIDYTLKVTPIPQKTAKFQTMFKTPTYFVGYPYSLSIITDNVPIAFIEGIEIPCEPDYRIIETNESRIVENDELRLI